MRPTAFVINPRAQRRRYGPVEQAILGGPAFIDAWNTIRAWPGYASTPQHVLSDLAARLGIASLHYKDEDSRFGLGSFKALGGAYAVAQLAATPGGSIAALTVTCATDGNHGRSVAWGAQRAGCRCVIFVHGGVSETRVAAIERYGAKVERVPGNYDDSVRAAAAAAAANGWVVVSDTSYAGYREIPRTVMQGYAILAEESLAQLGGEMPTHLFLQGGVGGFAAAVIAHLWEKSGAARPFAVVVEPDRADCLLQSARAGKITAVHGALDTLMAGLACGEPSLLAWEILQTAADAFISLPDDCIPGVMRLLAAPPGRDPPIVGGESGVAGLAGLLSVASDPKLREATRLNARSRVLVIGTEGATDPGLYARLVGHPS